MPDIYALTSLYDAVKALFVEDELTDVAFCFGDREPPKQINQGVGRAARVVFVPGVDGKLGTYGPPKKPGRNPRPLLQLDEVAQVFIWARDGSAPNDQRKQYEAAKALHNNVLRALHNGAHASDQGGRVKWSDPKRVKPENAERRFGEEWVITITVEAPVLDYAWPLAPADTEAAITNEMQFPKGVDIDGAEITATTAPGCSGNTGDE